MTKHERTSRQFALNSCQNLGGLGFKWHSTEFRQKQQASSEFEDVPFSSISKWESKGTPPTGSKALLGDDGGPTITLDHAGDFSRQPEETWEILDPPLPLATQT